MTSDSEDPNNVWAKAFLQAYKSGSSAPQSEWRQVQEALSLFEDEISRMNRALEQNQVSLFFAEQTPLRLSQHDNMLVSIFELILPKHFPASSRDESLGTLSFQAVVGGSATLKFGNVLIAEGSTAELKTAAIPTVMNGVREALLVNISNRWLHTERRESLAHLTLGEVEEN